MQKQPTPKLCRQIFQQQFPKDPPYRYWTAVNNLTEHPPARRWCLIWHQNWVLVGVDDLKVNYSDWNKWIRRNIQHIRPAGQKSNLKPELTEKIWQLHQQGLKPRQIAPLVGCKPQNIGYHLRKKKREKMLDTQDAV